MAGRELTQDPVAENSAPPLSCSSAPASCSIAPPAPFAPVPLIAAPVETLRELARRFGTPTYAYDIRRLRAQAARLRDNLPLGVEICYSLKANSSLGVCSVLSECGLGADVASAGELVIAREAGFAPAHIFLTGPDKSPAVLAELRDLPEVVLSLDSLSELRQLAGMGQPRRVLLRLRPDFCSYATCSAGPDSRFGLLVQELLACRPYLAGSGIQVVGFHVFAGSQVLSVEALIHHLRSGVDLALRAAGVLDLRPEIIDLGGGFGIPYGPDERELDLAPIAAKLQALQARSAPARLVIELGRYLVAQAGWYLTTVLAEQTHRGRPAVVVDGGSHQRTDMCGVGLRHKVCPLLVNDRPTAPPVPTDVLGCLSLPADVLVEALPLPPLSAGDVLAFPLAGAYGFAAAPGFFHAHPLLAEAAFDGERLALLRARKPTRSVLDGQTRWGD